VEKIHQEEGCKSPRGDKRPKDNSGIPEIRDQFYRKKRQNERGRGAAGELAAECKGKEG